DGRYRIESFFDVFTELSIDGGQSWMPGDGPVRVVLTPALAITIQPRSQTVNLGSNATFCATPNDPSLSYQWRFNDTNIPDATNTCYTRTNAQVGDAGSYTVVVTDSSGSITSAVATLSDQSRRRCN